RCDLLRGFLLFQSVFINLHPDLRHLPCQSSSYSDAAPAESPAESSGDCGKSLLTRSFVQKVTPIENTYLASCPSRPFTRLARCFIEDLGVSGTRWVYERPSGPVTACKG